MTANQHISTALASLGYLKPEHVRELSEVITNYVAEIFQGEARQLVAQELAKLQSGIEHVARIDTSATPDGYDSRVIGYGEQFTISQPVVTTVEHLLQAAIRVNTDDACKKHFEAAYDSMAASNFSEAFNLLAPVINYGVRPGAVSRSPETVIAQAAYMLLLIGRDINQSGTGSA